MVRPITLAPPPRALLSIKPYDRPLRFELFTSDTLAFAAAAFGFLRVAPSLALFISLFAAPAFLGLAAFGSAIGSAISLSAAFTSTIPAGALSISPISCSADV
jgi:hypothetical protein